MMEWLKMIITFISGFASCGLIQFFCKRRDEKKSQTKMTLVEILNKISSFGTALSIALEKWMDKSNEIYNIVETYIETLDNHVDWMEQTNHQSERLLEEHKGCFCEHAPTCPNRIAEDLPDELKDLSNDIILHRDNFNSEVNKIRQNLLSILDEITSSIKDYKSILNQVQEVYTIPKKQFNTIYPLLVKLDTLNDDIISKIISIKENPVFIGDENNRLVKPFIIALKYIEKVKLTIAEEIDKLY